MLLDKQYSSWGLSKNVIDTYTFTRVGLMDNILEPSNLSDLSVHSVEVKLTQQGFDKLLCINQTFHLCEYSTGVLQSFQAKSALNK